MSLNMSPARIIHIISPCSTKWYPVRILAVLSAISHLDSCYKAGTVPPNRSQPLPSKSLPTRSTLCNPQMRPTQLTQRH